MLCFSSFSLEDFWCHSICSNCLPTLHCLMAAFTSFMVRGSIQIAKSSTVGGIFATCAGFVHLECFLNILSMALTSLLLSTNFLLSSLVIFFISRSNSEYFLLSWSPTRSDWAAFITCLTSLLLSIFFLVSRRNHSFSFKKRFFSSHPPNSWWRKKKMI